MKFTVSLLLLGISLALGWPMDSSPSESVEDPNGWLVPQEDGTFAWMSKSEYNKLQADMEEDLDDNDDDDDEKDVRAASVTFLLNTQSNPVDPQVIDRKDNETLTNSLFNPSKPTRVIIHGWKAGPESDEVTLIRDAFLNRGDYNVITVDWSKHSQTFNYPWVTIRVPGVGKQVAKVIDFLNKNAGLDFKTIHVIGHDLGAHVAGFAGKRVKRGRITTIVGLNPVSSLYSIANPDGRLSANDATYVETIQTTDKRGFLEPIGKATFYPNGGTGQPGCGLDLTGTCAHFRSVEFYAEAVAKNGLQSVSCESYQKAAGKKCGNVVSSIRMGSPNNHLQAYGAYYVAVNKKSPYGK